MPLYSKFDMFTISSKESSFILLLLQPGRNAEDGHVKVLCSKMQDRDLQNRKDRNTALTEERFAVLKKRFV